MLTLCIFLLSLAWVYGDSKMRISQYQLSLTRTPNKTVHISCKLSGVPLENAIVHWYQQKEGDPLRRILYGSTKSHKQDTPNPRLEADTKENGVFYLIINKVIKSDEGTYYCACWDSSGWIKTFAEGTKLIVTPPDRNFGPEFSPKPTIFLPSTAEINLQKAGTYLCLLENFFPDVIKVHWKEKNSNTILESQQGTTMKTNDTYMKFSWLTLTANSMNKEHKCIVRHENNVNGGDQEILFPSMKKVVDGNNPTEKACLKDQSGPLQLQLINTSAFYTYLLLLLKSVIYFAIVAFCLFKRTAVCGDGESQ